MDRVGNVPWLAQAAALLGSGSRQQARPCVRECVRAFILYTRSCPCSRVCAYVRCAGHVRESGIYVLVQGVAFLTPRLDE